MAGNEGPNYAGQKASEAALGVEQLALWQPAAMPSKRLNASRR
jgi:hypothetical protein